MRCATFCDYFSQPNESLNDRNPLAKKNVMYWMIGRLALIGARRIKAEEGNPTSDKETGRLRGDIRKIAIKVRPSHVGVPTGMDEDGAALKWPCFLEGLRPNTLHRGTHCDRGIDPQWDLSEVFSAFNEVKRAIDMGATMAVKMGKV